MLNIVFMGTPEFAIPSLEKICNSHHKIVAVVTGPDKPVGRGLKLAPTPVKRVAQKWQIPVFTPEKLADESFVAQLRQRAADLFVVVAFRILPASVYTIPPKGTINLHASLLPHYRGAAPINWALINGAKETGVTTFFIEEKVDTGEWIMQRTVPIRDDETAGELHDQLSEIGADVLLETINRIETGTAPRIKQQGAITRAPKITKEICRIDWSKDAMEIYNLIRGLSPFPRAFSHLHGEELKIIGAKVAIDRSLSQGEPGEIIAIEKELFWVATGNGVIAITELQPENKRRMTAAEYLRGHKAQIGDRFG